MARLFALADLHLSLTGHKPMDRFGELWVDHAARMAEAWDRSVEPDDAVLLGGDLSWARDLEEATPDLAWIAARPGRKVLLRGNHDGWWRSVTRVRAALPDGLEPLQNNALRIGRHVIVGARGWTAPGDPFATPPDEKIFRRELQRLETSVAEADRLFGRDGPRVALMHYPPWIDPDHPSEVVQVLRRSGVALCLYGHFHGDDHRRAVNGVRDGIEYRFVAADAVGFEPVCVADPL
jgi:predicted phosphohydrolase